MVAFQALALSPSPSERQSAMLLTGGTGARVAFNATLLSQCDFRNECLKSIIRSSACSLSVSDQIDHEDRRTAAS